MKKAEFDFIVKHIVEEMVSYLMEDTKMSLPEAFCKVYGSALYSDLQNQSTHLYRYSPAYLYLKMRQDEKRAR